MAGENDNVIGGVSVQITGDLTQWEAAKAQAQASAQDLDRKMQASMAGAGAATDGLTSKTRNMFTAMQQAGVSADTYAKSLSKTAEGMKLAGQYAAFLGDAQKAAGASATAAAQATVTAGDQVMKSFQAQLSAAKATFNLRSAMTAQMFAEENAAADAAAKAQQVRTNDTSAFRVRMAKQQASEIAAAASAGAAAEVQVAKKVESEAASTTAFRQRMARQQAAEAATAEAERVKAEEEVAARAARVRSSIEGATPAQLRFAKATEDATVSFAAGAITEVEFAKATSVAKKALEESAAAAITGRQAYEPLAMLHEAMTGRWNRFAASASIEAQALAGVGNTAKFVTALMNPMVLATAAAGATFLGAAAAAYAYDEALRKLNVTAVGRGAVGGQTGVQLEGAAQGATGQTTIDISAARGAAAEFAAAGVRSHEVTQQLIADSAAYAQLTGMKLPAAQEALAKAMEDPRKGAAALNAELEFLTPTEERHIRLMVEAGDKAGAQAELTRLLTDRINGASAASGGLFSGFSMVTTAAGNLVKNLVPMMALLERFDQLGGNSGRAAGAAQAAAVDAKQKDIQNRAQLVQQSQLGEQAADQTPEGRENLQFEDMKARRAALGTGIAASQKLGDTAAVERQQKAWTALNDAIGRVTDSQGRYIAQADREHQIVTLQTQMATATKTHNAALRERLETQIALLRVGDKEESNAVAQRAAADQGALMGARTRTPRGPKDTFGEEQRARAADAAGELALAQAYLTSDSAAIKAEASRKALTEAMRQGRTQAQALAIVSSEEALASAKIVAEEAKKVSALEYSNQAEDKANAAVKAGTQGRTEAEAAARRAIEFRQLDADASGADAKTTAILTEAKKRLNEAEEESNRIADDRKAIDDADRAKNELALTNLKISMVGKPKSVSEPAIAQLTEAQSLGVDSSNPASPNQQAAISAKGAGATANVGLETATFMQQQKQAFDDASRSVVASTAALKGNAAEQSQNRMLADALNAAEKQGIVLTADQVAELEKESAAYGKLDRAAQAYKTTQESLKATEKQFADQFETDIEGLINHTETGRQALLGLVKTMESDVLKGTLTGEGPLAGLLGTAQGQGGQGGAIGMGMNALASVIPGLKGLSGGSKKPSGAAGDPLHVVQEGASGAAGGGSGGLFGGSGGGGLLGSLTGMFGAGAGPNATDMANMTSTLGDSGQLLSGAGGLSDLAGLFHTGTSYVGTPSRMVPTSPGLFINAPRLHSGLAPDEFPAILQRGEGVTRKGDGGRSGMRDVHVHVHGADPGAFQRSSGQVARETKRQMSRIS